MTDNEIAREIVLSHLWQALEEAEGPHVDGTGMDCSANRHPDCCSFCGGAEQIRRALHEFGVHAVVRAGHTVLVDDATMARLNALGIDWIPESEEALKELERLKAEGRGMFAIKGPAR